MKNLENGKFKYDFNDYIECEINGKKETLYRIVANRNILNPHGFVKQGDKGGYCMVGSLSTEGESWIDHSSIIGKDCHVSGNAFLSGTVLTHDVFVGGNVQVYNSMINPAFKASIYDDCEIGNSKIDGSMNLKGRSIIERCKINGRLEMEGDNELYDSSVKAIGNGIRFMGGKKVKNAIVTGKGTVGISDEVKIYEKEYTK